MKEELSISLMKEDQSPYFCGSAALIALYQYIGAIEKEMVDLKDLFHELKSDILYLEKKDADLFSFSLKKDELLEEEWKDAISIIDTYTDLFHRMQNIETFLPLDFSDAILRTVDFLKKTVKGAVLPLSSREDVPKLFERSIFELTITLRGGKHHE